MILKNHTTIDKFMLETAKDRSELIEYVTKNMERNLAEAMLDKIEPGKDYLIKLHGADYYEDFSRDMCGYKMALEVDGWTLCSERMPEYEGYCMANVIKEGSSYPIILMRNSSVKRCHEKGWINAWMPLPEPYKEK